MKKIITVEIKSNTSYKHKIVQETAGKIGLNILKLIRCLECRKESLKRIETIVSKNEILELKIKDENRKLKSKSGKFLVISRKLMRRKVRQLLFERPIDSAGIQHHYWRISNNHPCELQTRVSL